MTFTPEQIANGKTWIAALRSGDYRQGRCALRVNTLDGPKYCCLGVAVEVFQYPPIANGYIEENAATDGLGLSDEDQSILSLRNDTGHTFTDIADYLESFYGLTENAV